MQTKSYYVYILTNKLHTVFYIGVTNNISRRMFEHRNKLVNGFSSKYNLNKLVYYEIYVNVYDAINREKQLKNWKREWKLELIQTKNYKFKDLSEDIYQ
jgi:putative endonuclease